jgi:hypothetical protein
MKRYLSTRASTGAGHVALGALLLTQAAAAQSPAADKAAAEALFQQGIELMRVGKLTEACDRLEQSSAIERGIGTSLYLAECYEKAGRTASAWGLFREASSEAQARGETERALAGKRRADRLEPLLSRLTLQVAAGAIVPGLEVLRDGTPVNSGVWNVAVPVDPGDHRLQARAPGYVEWNGAVKVDPNGANVAAPIPALSPTSTAAAGPGASPGGPVGVPPPTQPASTNPVPPSPHDSGTGSSFGTQRTVGLVVGGVGLVALGVGTYFGIHAVSKNDSAKDYCPGGGAVCNDPQGASLTGDAQSAARLANVFVIGGALVAGAGTVLFFTAPHGSSGGSDAAKRVGFAADARGARVTLGGAF